MFKKLAGAVALTMAILSTTAGAQEPGDGEPSSRLPMTFHGESATLRVLANNPVEVEPGNGQFQEDEVEELYEEPTVTPLQPLPQPFVQTDAPTLAAVVAGTQF